MLSGEGSSLLRHEAVDRNTFWGGIKTAKNLEHLESILLRFAHPENRPATDGHSRLLHRANGAKAVLKRVGGDNVAIVFGRGVEVVIVGGDPCLFELAGGLIGELAESDTNLHTELFDVANDIQNRLKLSLSFLHPFPGRTHTEAACAGGFGLTRLRKDVLALH